LGAMGLSCCPVLAVPQTELILHTRVPQYRGWLCRSK
jgi:hypothetical protein